MRYFEKQSLKYKRSPFTKQAVGTQERFEYMKTTKYFPDTIERLGKQLNRGSKVARKQVRELCDKVVKYDLTNLNATKTLKRLKRKGIL